MLSKIDHIGIAVKDLERSNSLYAKLLGGSHYKIEEVISEKVKTSFFAVGTQKIELLQATSADSAIAKFISKRGEGIHHIAFEVKDIAAEIRRLKMEGVDFIFDDPKPGADNKMITFLHPKSCGGVLIELCQTVTPNHD